MLDNFKGSADAAFLTHIKAIRDNTAAMAHSLAIIAGILAKREGIPCNSVIPPQANNLQQPTPPAPQPQPSNHDTDHRDELQQLEETISNAYKNTLKNLPQQIPTPNSIWE